MMRSIITFLAILGAVLSTPAQARTRIVVLPPDAASNGPVLLRHIAESVDQLRPGDQLLVYATSPVRQIAAITPPTDATLNNARIRTALAKQLQAVKIHLARLPTGVAAEPPGSLPLAALVDELGRNVLPSLAEKKSGILLIGSLLHWDRRDTRASMADRYVPSDATLRAPRGEWVFSIAAAQDRLVGATLHFCTVHAATEFESAEHEERVRRFVSLWTTGQGGRVGTISSDLDTCWRRFNAGEGSGQPVYQPSPEGKAEMLRVALPALAALPAAFDQPGQWFLRDDVTISRTPPTAKKGVLWLGIKWVGACDLDLFARGEASSPWLYFASSKTTEGYFNKDFTSGTGEAQYEFIEFTREIDVAKLEAAVNLYTCDGTAVPEGTLRVFFAGKVYQAAFRLGVKTGNRGANPMVGPHWIRFDVRKILGLPAE